MYDMMEKKYLNERGFKKKKKIQAYTGTYCGGTQQDVCGDATQSVGTHVQRDRRERDREREWVREQENGPFGYRSHSERRNPIAAAVTAARPRYPRPLNTTQRRRRRRRRIPRCERARAKVCPPPPIPGRRATTLIYRWHPGAGPTVVVSLNPSALRRAAPSISCGRRAFSSASPQRYCNRISTSSSSSIGTSPRGQTARADAYLSVARATDTERLFGIIIIFFVGIVLPRVHDRSTLDRFTYARRSFSFPVFDAIKIYITTARRMGVARNFSFFRGEGSNRKTDVLSDTQKMFSSTARNYLTLVTNECSFYFLKTPLNIKRGLPSSFFFFQQYK